MELIEFQYIILKITTFIFKQMADMMSDNNMNEPTDALDHVGDRGAWLYGESPGTSRGVHDSRYHLATDASDHVVMVNGTKLVKINNHSNVIYPFLILEKQKG